jgi:dipeptidyl-peptidase 4
MDYAYHHSGFKNITRSLFAFVFILIQSGITAQGQTKLLSMEDAIMKARTTLAPQSLKQAAWVHQQDMVSFVETRNQRDVLVKQDAVSGKDAGVIPLADLNAALRSQKMDTLSRFPMLEWTGTQEFVFKHQQKELRYIEKDKRIEVLELEVLPKEAANTDKHSKTGNIAYTVEQHLFIRTEGKIKQITKEANANVLNGQSVHRNEFGITKGTFWSNSGSKLAFYRMDESMVKDYPIIDFNVHPAVNKNIKYPMAGDVSHQVTLGVYDLKTGQTIFMQTGEPVEQYLTNIAWSPDDSKIYIAVLNREQNHMKLNVYDAASGKFIRTLFEEKDEKFVEPLNPLVFLPNDAEKFIWQSNRDGYNHLYLYDVNGKLIRQLSKGNWEITRLMGFSANAQDLICESTFQSPLNRNVVAINTVSGKQRMITPDNGTYRTLLSPNKKFMLSYFSSLKTPNRIEVFDVESGKMLRTILSAENPLKDYAVAEPELLKLTSVSGEDLHARVFKPHNFDATKKYPVVVYVYGGPHAQMITNSWLGGANLWFHYMAQKGYVVFTLDNRGSDNRGKQFETSTFRQAGVKETEDQLTGVKYLKKQAWVDSLRIGVHGWSYGGFMTITMLTQHPGVFKAGVAGGPVVDWSMYEIMYTERYMDTPTENPEGYKQTNLLNHIPKLKDKLLVIHGTDDDVVVWQHSIKLIKKAVDDNIQLDYFVYPGHPHNVLGKDRVHLMDKVSQYFFDNL